MCLQQEAVDRVVSTLVCNESEARIALRHYRWKFDRLMGAMLSAWWCRESKGVLADAVFAAPC